MIAQMKIGYWIGDGEWRNHRTRVFIEIYSNLGSKWDRRSEESMADDTKNELSDDDILVMSVSHRQHSEHL